VSGGLLNLVGGAASGAAAFAVTIIAARGLGATGSAGFFEVIALFSILVVLGQAGAGSGLVRAVATSIEMGDRKRIRDHVRVAVVGVLMVSSLLAAGWVLLTPHLSPYLDPKGTGDFESVAHLVAPFLPAACLGSVLFAATRGFGTMAPSVWLDNVAKPVIRTLGVLAAVLWAAGPAGVAVSWVLPVPLAMLGGFLALRRLVQATPLRESSARTGQRDRLAGAFWRFSGLQVASEFFQVGVQWLDILLLGWLATEADVGVYAAVSRLVFVGLLGVVAVAQVVAPRMAALLSRNDTAEAQRLYQAATLWLMVAACPVYLFMAVYPELFVSVFGNDFTGGASVLSVLSIAMLANVATGPILVILVMGGRSGLGMLDSAVALGVNIALNLLLIPHWGMMGAALAWTASILIQNLLPLIQVRRIWTITPVSSAYAQVVLATTLCFGVLPGTFRLAFGADLLPGSASAAFGCVIYVAALTRMTWCREAWRELAGDVRRRMRLDVTTPA
jgi:O-antigen/teichoic acid export membrane protein